VASACAASRVRVEDYYYVGGYYGSSGAGEGPPGGGLRQRAELLQREVGLPALLSCASMLIPLLLYPDSAV
jgi:hypothetical protein